MKSGHFRHKKKTCRLRSSRKLHIAVLSCGSDSIPFSPVTVPNSSGWIKLVVVVLDSGSTELFVIYPFAFSFLDKFGFVRGSIDQLHFVAYFFGNCALAYQ